MYKYHTIITILLLSFLLTNCNEQKPNKTEQLAKEITILKHCVYSEDTTKNCHCAAQFYSKDSSFLTQIKDQFYRSKTGHLYEKTWSQQQLKGQDTLSWVLYFNGYFSQELDPKTFGELNGWYAKDKNYVYYYRPVSGGMQIIKIDNADQASFTLLAGHYKYGKDKNNYYEESGIIKGFPASKTIEYKDNQNRIRQILSGKKIFKFEIVN
jgi:hypothetical protein